MTNNERKLIQKRIKMRRRKDDRLRIRALFKELGIKPGWNKRDFGVFLTRLAHIAGDPLTDPDMRVMVKLYNRELIGRREAI